MIKKIWIVLLILLTGPAWALAEKPTCLYYQDFDTDYKFTLDGHFILTTEKCNGEASSIAKAAITFVRQFMEAPLANMEALPSALKEAASQFSQTEIQRRVGFFFTLKMEEGNYVYYSEEKGLLLLPVFLRNPEGDLVLRYEFLLQVLPGGSQFEVLNIYPLFSK